MPLGGVSQYSIQLFVKMDHIAALRQGQGGNDPVEAAVMCEKGGCHGITVHLREDRRHVQDRDVFAIKDLIRGKLNLEIALLDEMITIAQQVRPDQVTIVPEMTEERTTEGGLDVKRNMLKIKDTVRLFHNQNIRVSLLINPDLESIDLAKECEVDSVQIHTGAYSNAVDRTGVDKEIARIYGAADHAAKLGIQISVGRGINYKNIDHLLNTRGLMEVHIGRAIIEQSASVGLSGAVGEMLDMLE